MACPTIGEYSIQCIEVHDFLMDFGHKLEVVRSQSTGDIEIRIGSSTFSVVHCGGDVEFTDGEVEHGD